MMRPSEFEALHKKYAPSEDVYDAVYTHCAIVWKIARQLIRSSQVLVNEEFVQAGSMLHDIGVYGVYDIDGTRNSRPYIQHGIIGYEILKSEGLPEEVCRIASHHIGVGLDIDDIRSQNLPLPEADYRPVSTEERLVTYADKFHTKTMPPQFNSFAGYAEYISRFGAEKQRAFAGLGEEFGEPTLEPLAIAYGQSIV